jgi:hypothetical protein
MQIADGLSKQPDPLLKARVCPPIEEEGECPDIGTR